MRLRHAPAGRSPGSADAASRALAARRPTPTTRPRRNGVHRRLLARAHLSGVGLAEMELGDVTSHSRQERTKCASVGAYSSSSPPEITGRPEVGLGRVHERLQRGEIHGALDVLDESNRVSRDPHGPSLHARSAGAESESTHPQPAGTRRPSARRLGRDRGRFAWPTEGRSEAASPCSWFVRHYTSCRPEILRPTQSDEHPRQFRPPHDVQPRTLSALQREVHCPRPPRCDDRHRIRRQLRHGDSTAVAPLLASPVTCE